MAEAAPPPAAKPSASARVAKNSFWLIAQPLLMNAISLLAVAYIARKLGKENYGRFVFALSFIGMFAPLTNLGLRLLTVRHIATSDRKDLSDYLGKMTVLRFSLALATAALAALIVVFIKQSPETRQVVHLASAIIVLQAVTTTITDVFQGFETMRLDAQVRLTSGMVITVLSVVVLYLGYGLIGLMATYVVGNLVGTVVALYYLYTRFVVPKMTIDLRFWKENLVKAASFFFPTLISQAGKQMGVVILGARMGDLAVGTYGAASTLIDKLMIIPDGVVSALLPTLSRVYASSRTEAEALYRKFFGYFFVLGLPIAIGTSLVAEPIIMLLYGKAYTGSPLILAILVWGLFLTLFNMMQTWSVGAIHQERRAFFLPIIAQVIYLPAVFIMISFWRELGLAIAGVVLGVVTFFLFQPIIRAYLTARPMERRLLWRTLLANAVMAAVTYPLRRFPIFLSIPVAAVTYTAMVVVLRVVSREELTALVNLVRKRAKGRPAAPAEPAG